MNIRHSAGFPAVPHTLPVTLDLEALSECTVRRALSNPDLTADTVLTAALLSSGALLAVQDHVDEGVPGAAVWAAQCAADLDALLDAIATASHDTFETLWYACLSATAQLVAWGRAATPHRDITAWAGAAAEAAPSLALRRQTIDALLDWVDQQATGRRCVLEPTVETFGAMVALATAALYVLEGHFTDHWSATLSDARAAVEAHWPAGREHEWRATFPRPASRPRHAVA